MSRPTKVRLSSETTGEELKQVIVALVIILASESTDPGKRQKRESLLTNVLVLKYPAGDFDRALA
jgi:hypothetical protein